MTKNNLQLSGKIVLVTRPKEQAATLAELLERRGARVLLMPLIKAIPPENTNPLDNSIRNLERYDLVIFTSANGVRFFFQRADELKTTAVSATAKYVAVGPKTASSLKKYGARVLAVPEKYTGAAIVEKLGAAELNGKRALLPRADIAGDELPRLLKKAGAIVDDVAAYRTVPDDERRETDDEVLEFLRAGKIDCVTFTSPSTVKNFLEKTERIPRSAYRRTVIACIGAVTAEAAVKIGLRADVTPRKHTVENLVEEIAEYFRKNRTGGAE